MSLKTPDAIRTLQRKLYDKAKTDPGFRSYILYDKVWRAVDPLFAAQPCTTRIAWHTPTMARRVWTVSRSNRSKRWAWRTGCPSWARNYAQSMPTGWRSQSRGTYQCQAERRGMIPKPGGGERPLGLPVPGLDPGIRDRVVQTAAKLVLEPIPRVWLRQPEGML